jgi:hypothetical protein
LVDSTDLKISSPRPKGTPPRKAPNFITPPKSHCLGNAKQYQKYGKKMSERNFDSQERKTYLRREMLFRKDV